MSRVRPALGRATWQRARAAARKRDGGRCVVCGSSRNLVGGHRIPAHRFTGSHDALSNVWTLCQSCNVAQGRMSADEWKRTESYKRRLALRAERPRLSVGRPSSDVIRGDWS